MREPEGGETEYYYDGMNRIDWIEDPDDGVTDYIYDTGSRLTDMSYPNDTTTHYEYDAANRVTSMVTKDSSQVEIQSISYPEYDNVGNKLQMTDGTGTTQYVYDDLYRLGSVTYPDGKVEEYEYDAVGNRLRKLVNSEVSEQYGYNAANQLITRQVGGTGAPTKEITVSGDVSDPDDPPFSGVSSVTVNGVEAAVEGGTFTANGVILYPGENALVATVRDLAGNTQEDTITVTYDPDMTISYDYSYDDNGNLATKVKHSSNPDEITTYEYDYENRLISANNVVQGFSLGFVYDGDKRRVSRTATDGTVTQFFYDGINILKDYDAAGTELASYTQGIGIDSLITRKDANGARYFHSDALGSTRTMTDATESAVATYSYDAWGKVKTESGDGANEYKFTARRFEEDIALQYNRARFYDPEIGRWITQDPLSKGPDDPTITYFSGVYSAFHRYIKEYIDALQPDRQNRYVYCYNNPINLIDPLGLDAAKDETEKTKAEAKTEKEGGKKAETAGQQPAKETEQKGKTAEDVKKDAGATNANEQNELGQTELEDPEEKTKDISQPEPEPVPTPGESSKATPTPTVEDLQEKTTLTTEDSPREAIKKTVKDEKLYTPALSKKDQESIGNAVKHWTAATLIGASGGLMASGVYVMNAGGELYSAHPYAGAAVVGVGITMEAAGGLGIYVAGKMEEWW